MKKPSAPPGEAITGLSVAGYKSIYREQSIEIRPLTLLAGANSSGKSSIVQPLLLWKQTLEATYDPGPLLLNGPNVRFTSFEQLVPQSERKRPAHELRMGMRLGEECGLTATYAKRRGLDAVLEHLILDEKDSSQRLRLDMSQEERISAGLDPNVVLVPERCFLLCKGRAKAGTLLKNGLTRFRMSDWSPSWRYETHIRHVIHLPGLRGMPARTYPVTAVGETFPGTFEPYVASVILHWQRARSSKLAVLARAASKLGLTSQVSAVRVDDTQVELQVGRTPRSTKGGARDLVSLADVGYGVSQVLPVLVALLVAAPGQLVYIEQPEIHLHPRAQTALAEVLAEAALRGVQVVAETHSSLLLLGVQTLVAEGKLPPDLVKLHWFQRDSRGETTIRSADLDEAGAFGEDWPEDFAEVAMQAESRYLDAAEARQRPH